MSTYLVAFLVGDFQCTSGEQDGVALRVCATPDKVALTPFALNIAKFALHYYDDYFGIHYPLKKLDLIGIPDFEAGRHGELRRHHLPRNRSPDRSQDRIAFARKRMRLSTSFTRWRTSGSATWSPCSGGTTSGSTKASPRGWRTSARRAMHPEWNIPQVVAADEQRTLDIDAQPTTRAIRAEADTPAEIDQMFDSIAYGKAGDVLLMVENYLGEETFRKGVHAYLAAHEYGNATAEDFWNAQTEVSHKPVDKIMESLVAQPGVPILRVWRSRRGQGSRSRSRVSSSARASRPIRGPKMDAAGLLQGGREKAGLRDPYSFRDRTLAVRRPRTSSSPTRAARATTAVPTRPHSTQRSWPMSKPASLPKSASASPATSGRRCAPTKPRSAII